jgi:hypothetical protein
MRELSLLALKNKTMVTPNYITMNNGNKIVVIINFSQEKNGTEGYNSRSSEVI